jgi:RND family efflux transporter MFP subunit
MKFPFAFAAGCLSLVCFSQLLFASPFERIPGISRASYDARIGAALPGLVEKVHVKPGDTVKAGDPLVTFKHQIEKLSVLTAIKILEDRSEIASIEAQLDEVRKQLKALVSLKESTGSVSQDDIDLKILELRVGEANLARLNVREEKESLDLQMAEEQLKLRKVTAPKDGEVIAVEIDAGEYAATDEVLLRLVNIDDCYFDCSLTVKQSGRIQLGQKLQIELAVPGGVSVRTAEVVFVSPVTDPASGLRQIRLQWDNRNDPISPGVAGYLLLPSTQ